MPTAPRPGCGCWGSPGICSAPQPATVAAPACAPTPPRPAPAGASYKSRSGRGCGWGRHVRCTCSGRQQQPAAGTRRRRQRASSACGPSPRQQEAAGRRTNAPPRGQQQPLPAPTCAPSTNVNRRSSGRGSSSAASCSPVTMSETSRRARPPCSRAAAGAVRGWKQVQSLPRSPAAAAAGAAHSRAAVAVRSRAADAVQGWGSHRIDSLPGRPGTDNVCRIALRKHASRAQAKAPERQQLFSTRKKPHNDASPACPDPAAVAAPRVPPWPHQTGQATRGTHNPTP